MGIHLCNFMSLTSLTENFPGALTTAQSASSGRLIVGAGKKGDIKAKKIKILKTKLDSIKKAKTLKKMKSKKL